MSDLLIYVQEDESYTLKTKNKAYYRLFGFAVTMSLI